MDPQSPDNVSHIFRCDLYYCVVLRLVRGLFDCGSKSCALLCCNIALLDQTGKRLDPLAFTPFPVRMGYDLVCLCCGCVNSDRHILQGPGLELGMAMEIMPHSINEKIIMKQLTDNPDSYHLRKRNSL